MRSVCHRRCQLHAGTRECKFTQKIMFALAVRCRYSAVTKECTKASRALGGAPPAAKTEKKKKLGHARSRSLRTLIHNRARQERYRQKDCEIFHCNHRRHYSVHGFQRRDARRRWSAKVTSFTAMARRYIPIEASTTGTLKGHPLAPGNSAAFENLQRVPNPAIKREATDRQCPYQRPSPLMNELSSRGRTRSARTTRTRGSGYTRETQTTPRPRAVTKNSILVRRYTATTLQTPGSHRADHTVTIAKHI